MIYRDIEGWRDNKIKIEGETGEETWRCVLNMEVFQEDWDKYEYKMRTMWKIDRKIEIHNEVKIERDIGRYIIRHREWDT